MVVIWLSETTHLKYLSQVLAHYICTEKIDGVYDYYYYCAMHYYPTSSIGSQHFQCEESTLLPIHRVVSSIDFTFIRASPLHATTGSSSFFLPREPPSNEPSSLGASVIPWWSPAWVCIDSHYPHTPHPRALTALMLMWLPGRNRKIKPYLFPLSTIRPLAI